LALEIGAVVAAAIGEKFGYRPAFITPACRRCRVKPGNPSLLASRRQRANSPSSERRGQLRTDRFSTIATEWIAGSSPAMTTWRGERFPPQANRFQPAADGL
jgi:hypothetical protein